MDGQIRSSINEQPILVLITRRKCRLSCYKKSIMRKRKIFWSCNALPNWNWTSFNNGVYGKEYDVADDNEMHGIIFLPPRKDFWYTCAILKSGNEMGYAYFRYFVENGKDVVEAVVESPGNWEVHGKRPLTETSKTEATGGFNLKVSTKREEIFHEKKVEEMEVLGI